MSYESPFGHEDKIGRRLNSWARQLSTDKSYPWVGTGLIADLKKAAEMLGGPPFDEMFPPDFNPWATKPAPAPDPAPELEDWEKGGDEPKEYDL